MPSFFSINTKAFVPTAGECKILWRTISDTLGLGLKRVSPEIDWTTPLGADVPVGTVGRSPYSEVFQMSGDTPLYIRASYVYSNLASGAFTPQVEIQFGSTLSNDSLSVLGRVGTPYTVGFLLSSSTSTFTNPAETEFYISATPSSLTIMFGLTKKYYIGIQSIILSRLSDPSSGNIVGDFVLAIESEYTSGSSSVNALTNFKNTTTPSRLDEIYEPDVSVAVQNFSTGRIFGGNFGLTPDRTNYIAAGPFLYGAGRCWSMLHDESPIKWMPSSAGPDFSTGIIGQTEHMAFPSVITVGFLLNPGTGQTIWVRR